MRHECRRCKFAIDSHFDNRLPPWCPKCGTDFKMATGALPPPPAEDVAHAVSETPLPPARPEPVPFVVPYQTNLLPFFHARLASRWAWGNVSRVYVAGDDLLGIDLGVATLDDKQAATTAMVMMGGGLVAGLIAHAVSSSTRQSLKHLLGVLDDATEDALRQFADEDRGSFVLRAADVREPHLDPKTVWTSLTTAVPHVALLKFRHSGRGDVVLALQTLDDVAAAVRELPTLFADEFVNNVR